MNSELMMPFLAFWVLISIAAIISVYFFRKKESQREIIERYNLRKTGEDAAEMLDHYIWRKESDAVSLNGKN